MSGRRGVVGLVVVLAVAVVLGLVLSARSQPVPPFDVDSAAPDGLKAVRLLLEDRGVRVEQAPASALTDGELGVGPAAAVVMIAPSVASADEVDALRRAVEGGGLVVLGEPPPPDGADADYLYSALDEAQGLTDRVLADTPAYPVSPGLCDIAALDGLEDLDAAFAGPFEPPVGAQRCYAGPDGAYLQRQVQGDGAIVTLASPFLWVNARLQPVKEEGGEPLANGATAVRLLGDAEVVTFIDPVPSSGSAAAGDEDPLTLLPLPVKLALAQLLGALVLFIWWRSRRLGPPVQERLPVEIAGSELVVAVGDLLRRRGNAARAAESMRAETRRVLADRLGMGADPAPLALVTVVASRTGRAPDAVGAALYGDPAAPVTEADDLVRLVRSLDAIRQEVLHVAAR